MRSLTPLNRLFCSVLPLGLIAAAAACDGNRRESAPPVDGSDAAPPPSPPEASALAPKSYQGRGKVESIDRERQRVEITHEDIPGLMKGMTMPFRVRSPELLADLAPGDQVRFTLEVRGEMMTITAIEKEPAAPR